MAPAPLLEQRAELEARSAPAPLVLVPQRRLRMMNSQLDCTKLERTFRMRMPAWQDGVADCVQRIVKG